MLPPLAPRDRAFAELVRARGWVDDADLDRAVTEASTSGRPSDLASKLRAAGLLTDEQVASVWEAVDGVQVSRAGTWGGASSSDATMAPPPQRGFGAPSKPGGAPSRSDATIRAPSSASGSFGSSDAGATMAPSGSKVSFGSSVEKSTAGERSGDRIGPYKLMRELGRGGMGVVYRAVHVELRREVALKVMLGRASDDPDTERFRREAGLVARVGRHANLVSVHEIGREDDKLYFTMDYIDGRSAKQRVDDDGPFPQREAAALCADIAGALEFVHKAGVLHRDVKPHNVLIDRAGRAYLSDFGLAKSTEAGEGLTVTGAALGTPAYMAPEIAAKGAQQAKAASDVYSLGSTLYEMVTGKPAFTGLSGIDLIRAVVDNEPPSPRALRPDLHPDLDVICQTAMEKDPARRYASAAAMEADLRHYVNGEPIQARPVGKWEKLVRKARRNAGVLSAAVIAFAALASVGAWSGVKWWRNDQARRIAASAEKDRLDKGAKLLASAGASLKLCDEAEASGKESERAAAADRAVVDLLLAKDLLPESAEAHFLLGKALRRSGKPKDALAELEKAVERNPDHTQAWFEHGLIAQEAWIKVRGTLSRRISLARPNEFGYRQSADPQFQASMVWGREKGDDKHWRDIAANDFKRVLDTGAGKEMAAYGSAMMLYLDGKYAEALKAMDQAVELSPFYAPALEAEAEIRDYSTQDPAQGVEWRRRLFELEPHNPKVANDYALSLAAVGRKAEARDVVMTALAACDVHEWLVEGAWVLAGAAAFPDAESTARRSLALAKSKTDKLRSLDILREALLHQKRFQDARDVLDPAVFGEWALIYKAADYAEEGKYPESVASLRGIPDDSPYRHAHPQMEAWSEWVCGNLYRAKAAAEWGYKKGQAVPTNLPIIRLDLGEVDLAITEFQSQLAANPDAGTAWSNLAGAQFLKDDFPGAMNSLEQAFARSPVPDQLKEQAKKIFVNLKKSAKQAKTPAEAGKVVESIGLMLMLAGGQGGADAEGAGAARDAQRAIWWALQEFYWNHDLPEKSIACGDQYLALRRHGNILFKQARAYASLGKTDTAMKFLIEANENGFDEAKRLDGEKAFDALRQLPEFVELRKKCR